MREVPLYGRFVPAVPVAAGTGECRAAAPAQVRIPTAWLALGPYLAERVYKVVLQKSIPAQIRQLIPDIKHKLTDLYGN